MGRRGPPKTPQETMERRGSWRAKDPDNPIVTVPIARVKPEYPDYVTDEIKPFFDEVCRLLDKARLLTDMDGGTVGRYTVSNTLMNKMAPLVMAQDLMIEGKDGCKKKNPIFAMFFNLVDNMRRDESLMGMSPSARRALGVMADKTIEKLDISKAKKYNLG